MERGYFQLRWVRIIFIFIQNANYFSKPTKLITTLKIKNVNPVVKNNLAEYRFNSPSNNGNLCHSVLLGRRISVSKSKYDITSSNVSNSPEYQDMIH